MSSEYWKKLRDDKLGPSKKEFKKEGKQDLALFYEQQAAKAPSKCENCSAPLGSTSAFHPRAHICHIFPKADFDSIKTNPWNIWFGCIKCHTDYDSWYGKGQWTLVQGMRIWMFLPDRVSMFINDIAEDEQRRIPEIFKP